MVTVSCNSTEWDSQLCSWLNNKVEVDLVDFDYDQIGKLCESFARNLKMLMIIDSKEKIAHFRKSN